VAPEITLEELQKRVADPRHDRYSDKYDPDFMDETTAMWKRLHPPELDNAGE
jgi:hypothetical protein